MLYYTCLSFISILCHSYYVMDTTIFGLFTCLIPSSVMYHLMKEINHPHLGYVGWVDKSLAHISVIMPFYQNLQTYKDPWITALCLYIMFTYVWNERYNRHRIFLNHCIHATFQIFGTLGYHWLLYIKH